MTPAAHRASIIVVGRNLIREHVTENLKGETWVTMVNRYARNGTGVQISDAGNDPCGR